jgi:hypothetical protein
VGGPVAPLGFLPIHQGGAGLLVFTTATPPLVSAAGLRCWRRWGACLAARFLNMVLVGADAADASPSLYRFAGERGPPAAAT